jgi:methanogenic corrinoid protein MtbC1
MDTVSFFRQYLEHLFAGNRSGARELVFDAHDRGFRAEKLLSQILWPAMEQIEKLCRENRISRITEHMATRINRMIANQLHGVLNRRPKDGRRIVLLCGADESSELGAQIASDLFEARGWTVWFVGSGVANDEVLKFVGKVTPDILLVYSSLPQEAPGIRKLIALIREVGICEKMQIVVCGGIYNRADGLAEEIRADLSVKNVREAIQVLEERCERVPLPDVMEPGRRRKRKRKAEEEKVRKLREEFEQAADEPETTDISETLELAEVGGEL